MENFSEDQQALYDVAEFSGVSSRHYREKRRANLLLLKFKKWLKSFMILSKGRHWLEHNLKAVIDTNLFISGLFAKNSLSAQLQDLFNYIRILNDR